MQQKKRTFSHWYETLVEKAKVNKSCSAARKDKNEKNSINRERAAGRCIRRLWGRKWRNKSRGSGARIEVEIGFFRKSLRRKRTQSTPKTQQPGRHSSEETSKASASQQVRNCELGLINMHVGFELTSSSCFLRRQVNPNCSSSFSRTGRSWAAKWAPRPKTSDWGSRFDLRPCSSFLCPGSLWFWVCCWTQTCIPSLC